MEKNYSNRHIYSFHDYQNDIINNGFINSTIITNNNKVNENYNFENIIPNYNKKINNPLFKENNFFLKSSHINKSKKVSRLKNYYNKLILQTNQNSTEVRNFLIKRNKSLNNQCRAGIINDYYPSIIINDRNINIANKENITLNLQKTKYKSSDKNYNNNSFTTIYSYHNINNKTENNQSDFNIFNVKNSSNVRKQNNQKMIRNNNNKNKKPICKFSSTPYLATQINKKIFINNYNYYNKAKHNNNNYEKNNAINFNENINYNNIKNIQKNTNNFYNNIDNSLSRKIINYNHEKNNSILYQDTSSTTTKILINVFPNYQKFKNDAKILQENKSQTQKLTNNNICLKCQEEKLNAQNKNNYINDKKTKNLYINNYSFREIKNTKTQANENNHNIISKNIKNLKNKFNTNLLLNPYIRKEKYNFDKKNIHEKENKNYEPFYEKNKIINIKKISNNIKKGKRHKSKNQLNIEKNLDKKKSLSYRESTLIKPSNSSKKNKRNSNKNELGTLSQKKYKEDLKNIFGKETMNNLKYDLFENKRINVIKYNDEDLEKQKGCKFSIFKKSEKDDDECLNEIITYFNSENLKKKYLY